MFGLFKNRKQYNGTVDTKLNNEYQIQTRDNELFLNMNGDRNLGNLVFTGKKSFVAIDHGEILGGNAWHEDSLLKPTAWVRSVPMDACETFEPLPNTIQSAICGASDVAAETLWTNFAQLRAALNAETHRDTALALDAVWWRSIELSAWFKEKLKFML